MAEIKLTPSFPTFEKKTFPIVETEPSFPETFVANSKKLFGPAVEGNKYYMSPAVKRDLNFDLNKFFQKNNINPNSQTGKYISNYGFNLESANRALEHRLEMDEAQRQLEAAGFVKSVLSDSVLIAELLAIGGSYSLLKTIGRKQASKYLGDAF